jgi:PAH dioxygenase large subunit
MRVCRADRDNLRFMRCVYHGWAYDRDGSLAAAFAGELYSPGRLDKAELGLIPVTQVDAYAGFIFGTWSDEAPPLDEYLGNMRFCLDLVVNRTEHGCEVAGVPHVWEANTKSKLARQLHRRQLPPLHGTRSMVELGMLPPHPMSLAFGT